MGRGASPPPTTALTPWLVLGKPAAGTPGRNPSGHPTTPWPDPRLLSLSGPSSWPHRPAHQPVRTLPFCSRPLGLRPRPLTGTLTSPGKWRRGCGPAPTCPGSAPALSAGWGPQGTPSTGAVSCRRYRLQMPHHQPPKHQPGTFVHHPCHPVIG